MDLRREKEGDPTEPAERKKLLPKTSKSVCFVKLTIHSKVSSLKLLEESLSTDSWVRSIKEIGI